MNWRTITIIGLCVLVIAIFGIPVTPQTTSGCCCNTASGEAQKSSIQTKSECDTQGGFTFTDITKPFPFDTATICTETCRTALPPPIFTEGALQCGDPLFKPPVKDLTASPSKGSREIRLLFNTACPAQTNFFEVSRCIGTDCTNFALIDKVPKDKGGYIDNDPTILYNQDYTYRVIVNYQFQNGNSQPRFTIANPGDLECDNVLDNSIFCIGNDTAYYRQRFKNYLETNGYIGKAANFFKTDFDAAARDVFGLKLNTPWRCSQQNALQKITPPGQCPGESFCVVRDGIPQCLGKEDCKLPQPGTAFGLGFTIDNCEKKVGTSQPRYCYFDRSASVANDCFDCRTDMSCYDYRTEGTCTRNNCGAGACSWAFIFKDIGIGVCRDLRISNCFLCDLKGTSGTNLGGFNEIFDVCSPAKSQALTVPNHPCNFQAAGTSSTDCNAMTCRDYETGTASSTQTACATPNEGIKLDSINRISSRSTDFCNIGVCHFDGQRCSKNADAKPNLGSDVRDCIGKANERECELDNIAPTTTIIPIAGTSGRTDSLLINRRDAFNRTMNTIKVQPKDYPVFFCTYQKLGVPCTITGSLSTRSEQLFISNTRIEDIIDGKSFALARVAVGSNMIRYFAEDPNHNLGIINETEFSACDECQGPRVVFDNVSKSTKDFSESRYYTKDTKPVVIIHFNKAVSILRAFFLRSGENAENGIITDIGSQTNTPSLTHYAITSPRTFTDSKLTFSLFATDIGSGISMDHDLEINITIDTASPRLETTISPTTIQTGYTKQIINKDATLLHIPKPPLTIPFVPANPVKFILNFSEFVILDNISVIAPLFTKFTNTPASINLTTLFQTVFAQPPLNNRSFTMDNEPLPDGKNSLIIIAHDRALNPISLTIPYAQSASTPVVRLVRPALGATTTSTFDLELESRAPAECRYQINRQPNTQLPFNFATATTFDQTGDTIHLKRGETLPTKDTEFPLTVHCKDAAGREGPTFFSLLFDDTLPRFLNGFPQVDPVDIIEQSPNPADPSKPILQTSFLVQTDDATFCKFSQRETNYDLMEGLFPGFNETALKINRVDIPVQPPTLTSITPFSFNVACKNRAGLGPAGPSQVTFRVVPNVPFSASTTSHNIIFNETPVFVSAVSNKRSNCFFVEVGSTLSMEENGIANKNHRAQVQETSGNHTGTITCQPTGISTIGTIPDNPVTIPVSFIVDLINPLMQFVNDSSSLKDFPQITVLTDRLLLSWFGTDIGSGISYYNVSIKNLSGAGQPIIKSITTKKHFNATHILGLSLANLTTYGASVSSIDFAGRQSQPMDSDGVTTNFALFPTHCTNQKFEQETESDLDCGGECLPCPEAKRCNADADCQSLTCTGIGLGRTCQANPSCTDNSFNGDETDKDCGGPCKGCSLTQKCIFRSDCLNFNNANPGQSILTCTLGTCQIAGTCDNLIPNPGETDIDCGGSCKPCADGKRCRVNADCQQPSSSCDSTFKVILNATTTSQKTVTLSTKGEEPSDTFLKALFGTSTSFTKESQGGFCINQVKDSDGDGMPDAYEDRHGLDKINPSDAFLDNDKDGLINLAEFQYFNTSNISFSQFREIDPLIGDTDADGFDDKEEINVNTSPTNRSDTPKFHDRDRDGMSDDWELRYGLDPSNAFDKDQDPDSDNLTNIQEFQFTFKSGTLQEDRDSTHPTRELNSKGSFLPSGKLTGFDTDGDGLSDKQEIDLKFDPFDPNIPPSGQDTDGDGIPDRFERKHELNPFDATDARLDPDKDNLTNLQEFQYFNLSTAIFGTAREIFPRVTDTDSDTFSDSQEIFVGTNPTDAKDPPISSNPPRITLLDPATGVSPTSSFALKVGVDINSSCRFVVVPQGTNAPTLFSQLQLFDTGANDLYKMSYQHVKNTLSIPTNTLFSLTVECIDGYRRKNRETFDLLSDPTPPIFTAQPSVFPNPVDEQPFTVELSATTDDETICKFNPTQAGFSSMANIFPGADTTPPQFSQGHTVETTLPTAGTFSFFVACKNKAGLEGQAAQTPTITARASASLTLTTTDPTPLLFPTSQARLTTQTNKRSNCKFTESQSISLSSPNGFSHLLSSFFSDGTHTGTIQCTSLLGEQAQQARTFIVDSVNPIMESVAFIPPDPTQSSLTFLRNQLEATWKGRDPTPGSGIKFFNITIRNQTNDILLNTRSTASNTPTPFTIQLVNLTTYRIDVSAIDEAGLASPPFPSSIFVDFSKAPPHCLNKIKDSDETGNDCGGSCQPCANDTSCNTNADCISLFCNPTVSLCKSPTCSDGFKNGNESDIDCGGDGACARCTQTKKCLIDGDCANTQRQNPSQPVLVCGKIADNNINNCIVAPSCRNRVQDNGETDIDCGQVCALSPCLSGNLCQTTIDCAKGLNCTTLSSPLTQQNPLPQCVNLNLDTDSDGIPDFYEDRFGLNKSNTLDGNLDPDKDGLTTFTEFKHFSQTGQLINPFVKDTDNDGFSDGEEIVLGSNPIDPASQPLFHDRDNDGMSDEFEIQFKLNPDNPGDANFDSDGDGLTNLQEFRYFVNSSLVAPLCSFSKGRLIFPNETDTDKDGFNDQEEAFLCYDPTNALSPSPNQDTDGDGMPDIYERRHRLNLSDPRDAALDPDNDGLTNLLEFQYFNSTGREIDPQRADSDNDGFPDQAEVRASTNPVNASEPSLFGVTILLTQPPFGVATAQPFILQIKTDINSSCRFWFSPENPPVPPPTTFTSLDQFDSTGALIHTKNTLSGIRATDLFKAFPLFTTCIDAFSRQKNQQFNITLDNTAPTIIKAISDPEPIAQQPLTTTLTVVTARKSFCKFSRTITDFTQMDNLFPGFGIAGETIHNAPVTVPSISTHTFTVGCISPPGLGPTTSSITVHVDPQLTLQLTRITPAILDISTPTISVRTNKDAICDYIEGSSITRLGSGNLSRLHETTMPFTAEGIHNATVRCTTPSSVSLLGVSETVSLAFGTIIDTLPPSMEFINDDGPILSNPEVSYFKDRLRFKFKAKDDASGVAQYFFKLTDSNGRVIIDLTPIQESSDFILVQAPLVDKQRYFFTVFAKDKVGLSSAPLTSNGITVDFSAMPTHCTNGVKDTSLETDIDCGIECLPCGSGFVCSKDIECTSNFCNTFTTPARCAQATCSDTFKNQNETDADCGGIGGCNRCIEGKQCVQRSDCAGNLTCKTGLCTKATACENLIIDGSESDIDCGGECTTKCTELKQCKTSGDCQTPFTCNADTSQILRCIDPGTDTDKDGIPDGYELRHGLNPNNANDAFLDPDGDKLTNLQEFQYFKNSQATFNQTREIDPQKADSDGDGFTDQEEVLAGTNPIDTKSQPPPRDTDRDGIPDEYEIARGLNPNNSGDALLDQDADGLTALQEFQFFRDTGRFIDPKKRDTDGDGFSDKVEIDANTDPADPASHPPLVDSDGDGIPDTYELKHFLNPLDPSDAKLDQDSDNITSATEFLYFSVTGREIDPRIRDTDNDGFTDNQEIFLGTNPINSTSKPSNLTQPLDTDNDGIPDSYEKQHGLNPTDATDATKDPDGDGLTNFQEFQYFLFTGREIDPQARDSDGDGYNDGQEVRLGFNPLDVKSKPSFPPDLDGDGIDDTYEKRHGLNFADPTDATKDPDGDGLTTLEEYNYFTFTGREIDPQKADTDGDGFSDKIEIQQGTNPVDPKSKPATDSDNDGLPNTYELTHGLDPNDPTDASKDSDGDGLSNLQEFTFFLNTGKEIDPKKTDTDGDGFSDKDEILLGFDPIDPRSKPPAPKPIATNDKDGDGIADDWEARHNLNPSNASDANLDSDGDGLTNLQEFQYFAVTGREIDPVRADTDGDGFTDLQEILAGTNPIDPASRPKLPLFIDSDNDGMPDDFELRNGLNPNDATDAKRDLDSDGLTNFQEFEYFRATGREISPRKADTDGDGFTDLQEILFNTNPIDARSHPPLPDTDGDGLDDLYELRHGLNPNDATDALKDPDKDGLTNEEEYQFFKDTGREIDPQKSDTDNDGFSDKDEINLNTNPVDPRSFPTNVIIDKDNDGIPDNYELRNGLNPADPTDASKDPDGDGLTNLQEFQYFRDTGREISPTKADTDGDGESDKQEITCNSNPIDNKTKCTIIVTTSDKDNDGIPDDYEQRHGLDPTNAADASADPDRDGLTNLQEFQFFKNTQREIDPQRADTDGDGFTDKQEIEANPPSNPIDPSSKPESTVRPPPKPTKDKDGDGIPDDYETDHGMDPDDRSDARQDPDGDGLTNLQEFRYFKNTGREIDPQRKDSDTDGFSDKEEIDQNTNPLDNTDHPIRAGADSDSDGIPDDYEQRHGLNPNDGSDAFNDPDNDGLTNKEEFDYFKRTGREINPAKADSDGDQFTDKEEVDAGFDPTNPLSHPTKDPSGIDTDKDGLNDAYETKYGLDPKDPSDALQDPDIDGLTSKAEFDYFRGSGNEINPNLPDTDRDGYTDKAELEAGTNPIDPKSTPIATPLPPEGAPDTDADGIPDSYEIAHGLDPNDPNDASQDPDDDKLTSKQEFDYFKTTNKFIDPINPDTDKDGFTDKEEIDLGTDPTDPQNHPSGLDSDKDGIPDEWEIKHSLNPNDPADASEDPNKSGLTNLQKYEYYKLTGRDLDPFKADTDGDGFNDSIEIAANTDPTNPSDHPTRTWLMILLILITIGLLGGAGYAGYMIHRQRKIEQASKSRQQYSGIPKPAPIPFPKSIPVFTTPKPIEDEFKELSELTQALKKEVPLPPKGTPAKEALQPAPGTHPLTALQKIAAQSKSPASKGGTTITVTTPIRGERQKIFEKLRQAMTAPPPTTIGPPQIIKPTKLTKSTKSIKTIKPKTPPKPTPTTKPPRKPKKSPTTTKIVTTTTTTKIISPPTKNKSQKIPASPQEKPTPSKPPATTKQSTMLQTKKKQTIKQKS